VRDALLDAIKALKQPQDVTRKIREAAVFIGDVTPVSKIPKRKGVKDSRGKRNMNPNVAIERGYAQHARTSIVERVLTPYNWGALRITFPSPTEVVAGTNVCFVETNEKERGEHGSEQRADADTAAWTKHISANARRARAGRTSEGRKLRLGERLRKTNHPFEIFHCRYGTGGHRNRASRS